jgi:hypothetical protein
MVERTCCVIRWCVARQAHLMACAQQHVESVSSTAMHILGSLYARVAGSWLPCAGAGTPAAATRGRACRTPGSRWRGTIRAHPYRLQFLLRLRHPSRRRRRSLRHRRLLLLQLAPRLRHQRCQLLPGLSSCCRGRAAAAMPHPRAARGLGSPHCMQLAVTAHQLV